MLATGTATDPLGADDVATLTVLTGGATGVHTPRTSFFANRVNWGNSITETNQGPESSPDPYNHLNGPWTLGFQVQAVIGCRSTGMRVMKMPAGNGNVTALCWNSAGVVQASKTATWVADDGGWYEFVWNAPVNLTADATYYFGYHYPTADKNWAASMYVWNNSQDTCVYPLLVLGTSGPTFYKAGASATFTSTSSDYNYHNVYVDPVVEWDVDVPAYTSGTDYFDQFPNGGPTVPFPLIIDWADAPYVDDYAALGMNTLIVGGGNESYFGTVKATGIDFYPALHGGDTSGIEAALDDEDLAPLVRGYFLTDEPEFSSDTQPATLRTWRNTARRLDSTRPIHLNLGRMIIENQGFSWHPVGISAKDVNLQWREYMSLVDIGSMDGYGIAHSFPYTYQGSSDTHRYGIWIYPLQIHRMRTEITDERMPIWGEVETTSAYPDSPTPTQVKRAVWSMLIAGAKGIIYFDHRFAGAAVSQDFAAMIHDSTMASAVSALNTQITSLAAALNTADAGLVESCTATGTLATAQGGLPAGVKIPVHYTSRLAGGSSYIFAQSIRDGSAGTVTFRIPSLAGATLTVIGESRTRTIDGSGVFTDTFSGDYTYHLYSTTADPVFSAPANTAAPVITTDGTPETGETVTCSTGTWTGSPAPTFTYQWHRNVGGDIVGATSASHVLVVGDESALLTCKVTATNSQGSSTVSSNQITPTAPGASSYATAVTADSPVAWWRLKDFTDAIGALDLTESAAGVSDTSSLVTDTGDGAQAWDFGGTACLSVADAAALRLGSTFSLEAWIKPTTGSFRIITKTSDYRLGINSSGKFEWSPRGAGGYDDPSVSTTTVVAGTTYHVVCTWNASTKIAKMYVNGSLETTYDQTGHGFTPTTSGWTDLRLGSNAGLGGTGFAAGTLDEVAIYNTVLDATQVATHHAAGTA